MKKVEKDEMALYIGFAFGTIFGILIPLCSKIFNSLEESFGLPSFGSIPFMGLAGLILGPIFISGAVMTYKKKTQE